MEDGLADCWMSILSFLSFIDFTRMSGVSKYFKILFHQILRNTKRVILKEPRRIVEFQHLIKYMPILNELHVDPFAFSSDSQTRCIRNRSEKLLDIKRPILSIYIDENIGSHVEILRTIIHLTGPDNIIYISGFFTYDRHSFFAFKLFTDETIFFNGDIELCFHALCDSSQKIIDRLSVQSFKIVYLTVKELEEELAYSSLSKHEFFVLNTKATDIYLCVENADIGNLFKILILNSNIKFLSIDLCISNFELNTALLGLDNLFFSTMILLNGFELRTNNLQNSHFIAALINYFNNMSLRIGGRLSFQCPRIQWSKRLIGAVYSQLRGNINELNILFANSGSLLFHSIFILPYIERLTISLYSGAFYAAVPNAVLPMLLDLDFILLDKKKKRSKFNKRIFFNALSNLLSKSPKLRILSFSMDGIFNLNLADFMETIIGFKSIQIVTINLKCLRQVEREKELKATSSIIWNYRGHVT